MGTTELFVQVKSAIRLRHYSVRTEQAYLDWIRKFIGFHGNKNPREMNSNEIQSFLTHLATKQKVAASTQNQALSAILFLYRDVLKQEVRPLKSYVKASRPKGLPVILSREEIQAVLDQLEGPKKIMAALLYGSGLRLMECLRLRIRDIDFEKREIIVRDTRDRQDRATVLPESLVLPLMIHLKGVREIHKADLKEGYGRTTVPKGEEGGNSGTTSEWDWQYVFPSSRRSLDRSTGEIRRHHVAESALQKAVKGAVRAAGVQKPASCHTLRHSFAVHLLGSGYDIEKVRELLGHQDVKTTMVYLHLVKKGGLGVRSPLDFHVQSIDL